MTDADKERLEIARAAVLKAARVWRDNCDSDRAQIKLFHAVDYYEDLVYSIEHGDLTDSERNPHSEHSRTDEP